MKLAEDPDQATDQQNIDHEEARRPFCHKARGLLVAITTFVEVFVKGREEALGLVALCLGWRRFEKGGA